MSDRCDECGAQMTWHESKGSGECEGCSEYARGFDDGFEVAKRLGGTDPGRVLVEKVLVELHPAQNDVIDTLENALERARRGEVLSVGVCEEHAGGTVATGFAYTEQGSRVLLYAAANYLSDRIGQDAE